jgi:excisionase family DNA binding protein
MEDAVTKPVTWSPDAETGLQRIKGRLFANTTEAAAILGVDPRTLRSALERGEVPGTRTGTTWRIPVSWLKEQARVDAA